MGPTEKKRRRTPSAGGLLTLAAILLIAAACGGIAIKDPLCTNDQFGETITDVAGEWKLTAPDGSVRTAELPAALDGEYGRYTLSRVIPKFSGVIGSPAVVFRTCNMNVAVSLDGEALYSFPETQPRFISATGWTDNYVRLPSDYAGRSLVLTLELQPGGREHAITELRIGAKASLLRERVLAGLTLFIGNVAMAFFGAMMLILYFRIRRSVSADRSMMSFGVFALLCSLSGICGNPVTALLVRNYELTYFLAFAARALMPVPLLELFALYVDGKFRRLMNTLLAAAYACFFAQMALGIAGAADMQAMRLVTYAMYSAASVASVGALLGSSPLADRERMWQLAAAAILTAGFVFSVLSFGDVGELPMADEGFQVGAMAFTCAEIAVFAGKYVRVYRGVVQAEVFRNLAMKDKLTGIGNRNAYELRLSELENAGSLPRPFCCVIADINNLKKTNDESGHVAGDRLIIDAARLLGESCGEEGELYRIGGDEYAALLPGRTAEEAEGMTAALRKKIAAYNAAGGCNLCIAVGAAALGRDGSDIRAVLAAADAVMYNDKLAQKTGASGAKQA